MRSHLFVSSLARYRLLLLTLLTAATFLVLSAGSLVRAAAAPEYFQFGSSMEGSGKAVVTQLQTTGNFYSAAGTPVAGEVMRVDLGSPPSLPRRELTFGLSDCSYEADQSDLTPPLTSGTVECTITVTAANVVSPSTCRVGSTGFFRAVTRQEFTDPSSGRTFFADDVDIGLSACGLQDGYYDKHLGGQVSVKIQASPVGAASGPWQVNFSFTVSEGVPAPTPAPLAPPTKTIVIAGLGDSLASGEGNPDTPATSSTPAVWRNPRCHRSNHSFEAITAANIAAAHPTDKIDFLFLACSGASTISGMTEPYIGIAPGDVTTKLPSQIEELRDKLNKLDKKQADAVELSIGVDDLHFGGVLAFCVEHASCRTAIYHHATSSSPEETLAQYIHRGLEELPLHYDELAKDLQTVVAPNRVFITQYPDILRDQNGALCSSVIDIGPSFLHADVGAQDVEFLENDFAKPLNAAIAEAARAHHWQLVPGVAAGSIDHGYCAGNQSWVVTYQQSKDNQGNEDGTMHPNADGQTALANLITPLIGQALFPPQ